MNVNVSTQKCNYVINQEKRKVICIIDNTNALVADLIPDNVYCMLPRAIREKLAMPKRFVGIATCASEDEWNEEVGKKIAFVRAKYKLNISLFKRAHTLMAYLDNMIDDTVSIFNTYGDRVRENLEKHVTWLQEHANIKLNLDL